MNKVVPSLALEIVLGAIVIAGCVYLIPEETLTKIEPLLDGMKIEINMSFPELFLLFIGLEICHAFLLLLWKWVVYWLKKSNYT